MSDRSWPAGLFSDASRARRTRPRRVAPPGRRTAVLCLLVIASVAGAPLRAEEAARRAGPPVVPQVAGNCYERIVRSDDGELTGHQRIRVRDPTRGPRGAEARIDVVSFKTGKRGPDGELRVDDRFDFKMIGDISQEAQKEEAALQIVGYVGSNSRVALGFPGPNAIYPTGPCTGESLPPVQLNLSVKGGFVDLLGGRAEIRIADRVCMPAPSETRWPQSYVIQGRLRLKVYLLGIPFKKDRYTSWQLVDPEQGLIRHVIEDRDGGRQALTLVDQSACSPPWRRLAEPRS